jgi:hypothetical protein
MVDAERLDRILDRALGQESSWHGADPQLAVRARRKARLVRVAEDLHSLGRSDLAAQLLRGESALLRHSDYPPAA